MFPSDPKFTQFQPSVFVLQNIEHFCEISVIFKQVFIFIQHMSKIKQNKNVVRSSHTGSKSRPVLDLYVTVVRLCLVFKVRVLSLCYVLNNIIQRSFY
jgi:hypothetical protein